MDFSTRRQGNATVREARTIKADVDCCFLAFADAQLLSKWFTTKAIVDLRVGGEYSNGDHDRGIYLEVDRPCKLRFTWENPQHCPGTEIEICFESLEPHLTRVTLQHAKLADEDFADHMRSGWMWAMDNVKQFLESGVTIGYEAWLEQRKKQD